MAAGADNIWSVPVSLHSLQPDLTDEALAEAEKFIGHRLPSEYVALLRVQNGGGIRYELAGTVHRSISGIGPRYPSLVGFDWSDSKDEVDFPVEGLLPFDGDGHWYLCIDYRERESDPPITLVDIEMNQQQFMADSFAAYLARLRRTVYEDFVLPGHQDLKRLKSVLTDSLRIRFDPPRLPLVGYDVHRGTRPAEKDSWVTLSPNTVPRGYKRKGGGHYTKIERFMNGTAERYPEVAAGSWLISTTDFLKAEVAAAFAASGIEILPLRPLVADAADPIL